MKMPGNNTSNSGLYEYDENTYYAESLDNSVMEEFNDTAETDFSEYLWMEHEEEFDKEVLQRLEEEALMEECLEAFMNDEKTTPNPNNQNKMAQILASSKLNPEAAEFVPKTAPTEESTASS